VDFGVGLLVVGEGTSLPKDGSLQHHALPTQQPSLVHQDTGAAASSQNRTCNALDGAEASQNTQGTTKIEEQLGTDGVQWDSQLFVANLKLSTCGQVDQVLSNFLQCSSQCGLRVGLGHQQDNG
jgi:hypothetical protein